MEKLETVKTAVIDPTGQYRYLLTRDWGDIGDKMFCLKINKSGSPAHPLYLKKDSTLLPFRLALQ